MQFLDDELELGGIIRPSDVPAGGLPGKDELLAALAARGVVLLRGFSFDKALFERFTDGIGTVRPANVHWVTTRKFESSRGTESVDFGNAAIPLHAESYYTPICPQTVVFWCANSTAQGGETLLCDGQRLYESLPPDLQEVLRSTVVHWRYRCSFDRLVEQTQRPLAEFLEWCARAPDCAVEVDDKQRSLSIAYSAPAIRTTQWTRRPAFANNLLSLAGSGVLADWVDDLDPQILATVEEIAEKQTYRHAWQTDDVLIVDNTRSMHGRAAWTGGTREVRVRMLTSESLRIRHVGGRLEGGTPITRLLRSSSFRPRSIAGHRLAGLWAKR
jgi:alpha-ketoglutarate-dependent taurine dioxygenase